MTWRPEDRSAGAVPNAVFVAPGREGGLLKIVLLPPIGQAFADRIRAVAPDADVVAPPDEAASVAAVAEAEVILGNTPTRAVFQAATRLRWFQTESAGMNALLEIPELRDGDFTLTNGSGLHQTQVAELAWALTLALFKRFPSYAQAQRARLWDRDRARPRDLDGATAGIVGFGGVGRQYAKRGAAFGVRILAVDVQRPSKPEYAAALWGMDRLDDVLKAADVLFLACPHTPETDKLIDARAFRLMKETAFLVNTARGRIVDEAALVTALREGEIAGAGLDVFEEEPLPEDSPLWEMENVILFPHMGGGSMYRSERVIDLFCENLRRYLAGSPLLNEVDRKLGYPRAEQRMGY